MKYLLFLLIGLVLVGCSDEKYVKGGHYIQGTETEENFRSALHGNFLLVDSLVPVDLKITVVDDQLDSLMSVKALVLKTSEGSYIYKAEPADYPSRYLKFSFTCLHSDSAFKMEFVQYVDYASDSVPVLNVLEALESERVESLVRKEKFYLEQAKIKALREVYRMLDCDSLLKGISYQDSPRTLWWLPYLYGKYDVRSSDSVFYAVYAKLRSAVGSEKTWHDYVDETEIVDSLYSRYRRGINQWGTQVEKFNYDRDYTFLKLWADYYGLGVCADSTVGDTVRIADKESAFNGDLLVCGKNVFSVNHRYFWRRVDSLETVLGLCLRDTLVLHDSVLYDCNVGKMEWNRLSLLETVLYIHEKCSWDRRGEVVVYDSVEVSCDCDQIYSCAWKEGLPEDSVGHFTPVDHFVKKTEGECTLEREKETVAVGDSFYICDSTFWRLTDAKTHYLGDCDSSRRYEKFKNNTIGAFVCDWVSRMPSGWKWVELTLPEYYDDPCNADHQNEMTSYENVYYTCSGSEWRVATSIEVDSAVLNGAFCNLSIMDSIQVVGDDSYICEDYRWRELNPYEIQFYKAMEKFGVAKDYCSSGPVGTTLFWDETDKILYGCTHVYSKGKYRYLWRGVSFKGDSKSVAGHYFVKMEDVGFFGNAENLAGGKFTADNVYELEYGGNKYIFKLNDYSINDDNYGILNENEIVVDGKTFDWQMDGKRLLLRKSVGDAVVSLDSIEGKSADLEDFFESWMTRIVESSQCPEPERPTISCARKTRSTLKEVLAQRYGENSYTTLSAAQSVCPTGFHIPDSTEWKSITNVPRLESPLAVRQYKNVNTYFYEVRYSLFWTSNEKGDGSQHCYEYIRETREKFYGYQVSEEGREFLDRDIVAGRILECPKDLFPMVQTLCISGGEN